MATNKLTLASGITDIQFVDLSSQAIRPKVVREGYEVPAAQVNKQRAEFVIDQLPVTDPKLTPRVVTQSVEAKTQVARGTVVNLVLAPKRSVPWSI